MCQRSGCWLNVILRNYVFGVSVLYLHLHLHTFFFVLSPSIFGANIIWRLNVTYSNRRWIEHILTVFFFSLFTFIPLQLPRTGIARRHSDQSTAWIFYVFFFRQGTLAWVIDLVCKNGRCFAVNRKERAGRGGAPERWSSWWIYRFRYDLARRLCIHAAR